MKEVFHRELGDLPLSMITRAQVDRVKSRLRNGKAKDSKRYGKRSVTRVDTWERLLNVVLN